VQGWRRNLAFYAESLLDGELKFRPEIMQGGRTGSDVDYLLGQGVRLFLQRTAPWETVDAIDELLEGDLIRYWTSDRLSPLEEIVKPSTMATLHKLPRMPKKIERKMGAVGTLVWGLDPDPRIAKHVSRILLELPTRLASSRPTSSSPPYGASFSPSGSSSDSATRLPSEHVNVNGHAFPPVHMRNDLNSFATTTKNENESSDSSLSANTTSGWNSGLSDRSITPPSESTNAHASQQHQQEHFVVYSTPGSLQTTTLAHKNSLMVCSRSVAHVQQLLHKHIQMCTAGGTNVSEFSGGSSHTMDSTTSPHSFSGSSSPFCPSMVQAHMGLMRTHFLALRVEEVMWLRSGTVMRLKNGVWTQW